MLLVVAGMGMGAARAEATQGRPPARVAASSQGEYSDLADAGVHRGAVEALAADGVLDGTECAPGQFCPNDPLSRRMMAVWLVRLLDGDDPEATGIARFADIAADARWAAHIERLADLRVTRGCFGLLGLAHYCPDRAVTRAQMAAFLVRAFHLPPGVDAGFEDVASDSTFRADIDSLAAAGITFGCAAGPPTRYCPNRAVTRAEMASFLHRARVRPTVQISWVDLGIATGCPLDVVCKGLLVELDGDWESTTHRLQCVVDGRLVSREVFTEGRTSIPGPWPPQHITGHIAPCADRLTWSGWGGNPSFNAVYVIVDRVKSNTLQAAGL